jgi:putative DNA primase/helicase
VADLTGQIEQALAARKGKRRGDELDFLCVSHEEQVPSASWNRKKQAWKCLACGAGGGERDLAKQLGIHVETPRERAETAKVVASYDYRDAAGNYLYSKCRMSSGKPTHKLAVKEGSRWRWGMGGREHVMYRLPELLASTDEMVIITEGEKDAETAARLGFTATCGRDGASEHAPKWKPNIYNPPLQGKRLIVVIPDKDTGGMNEAAFTALSVRSTGAVVKLLDLWPGEKVAPSHGKDLTDWVLETGAGRDELLALIEACPEWAAPEAPKGLVAFAETHAGQAELFAHLYGDKVRFDHLAQRWLVWERHRWVPETDGELYRLTIEAARARAKAAADLDGDSAKRAFSFAKACESTSEVEKVLKAAKNVPPLNDKGRGWDANPLVAGMPNGVMNMATGEYRHGRAEDRITMTINVEYHPDAVCPLWEKFLKDVFVTDEMVAFVHRMVGFFLTGDVSPQVWFVFHGSGGNGKSTFLNVLLALMGEYAGTTGSATICGKTQLDGSAPEPNIIALQHKRLVVCNESGIWARINGERVKELTGGTPISARGLYSKNSITFQPTFKLVLATNHLPNVDDDSHAMWRRIRLIPFTQKFEGADRDERLEEKLKQELQGILAWAVRGAVEYHRVGLQEPQAVMLATLDYRESSDVLADFISERCVLGSEERGTRAALFNAYRAWGEGQGYREKDLLSVGVFGKKLGERFANAKWNGQRVYRGFGVRV